MKHSIEQKLIVKSHYKLAANLYKKGRLEESKQSLKKAIEISPEFLEAYNLLGIILKDLGLIRDSIETLKKSLKLNPNQSDAYVSLGNSLNGFGKLEEAQEAYKKAIALKNNSTKAYNHMGVNSRDLRRFEESEKNFRKSLEINRNNLAALHGLAITLNAMDRREDAMKCFKAYLYLERGAHPLDPNHNSFLFINKAKVEHDIEQFEYLVSNGYDIKKFRELADKYKDFCSIAKFKTYTENYILNSDHREILGETYNRSTHILDAPEQPGSSLGNNINTNKITEDYFNHEFGLTYVDGFLNPSALKALREFLLGSTIWTDNMQNGGYLGAYLSTGLASPLILQIAEDLRRKFPKIFKNHFMTQIWAYKYDSRASDKDNDLSGIKVHADMAAINVNFWITSNSANLDSSSGGLVVYHTESPLGWVKKDYNENKEKIYEEIQRGNQEKTVIPYNENRAVLFNSSLFHETDNIKFKEGYENRRINVTILFGKRENR